MKILAIGDPHGDLGRIRKIPKKGIDLIIVTGDFGDASEWRKEAFANIERKKKGLPEIEPTNKQKKERYLKVYNSTLNVINYLRKFAPVFLIYGNIGVETSDREIKEHYKKVGKLPMLTSAVNKMKNVSLINQKKKNLKGVKIGGVEFYSDVSWVKEFKPDEYNKRMKKARKQTDKVRRVLRNFGNLDILVCHQPPYGVLDKVTAKYAPKGWRGKHAGGKAILDYVKKYQPKYVFCGHIHEGEGKAKIGKSEVYNLGVCGYKIVEI